MTAWTVRLFSSYPSQTDDNVVVDLRKVSCEINLANFLAEIGGIENLERYALEVTSLADDDGKIGLQIVPNNLLKRYLTSQIRVRTIRTTGLEGSDMLPIVPVA